MLYNPVCSIFINISHIVLERIIYIAAIIECNVLHVLVKSSLVIALLFKSSQSLEDFLVPLIYVLVFCGCCNTLPSTDIFVRQETVRREETLEVPQGLDKGHQYRTETLF